MFAPVKTEGFSERKYRPVEVPQIALHSGALRVQR
jgi:hypothetical protein